MFGYNCNFNDSVNLKYWVINKNLVCKTPKFYEQDKVVLSVREILNILNKEAVKRKLITEVAKKAEEVRDTRVGQEAA
jgi:hypothetical protein